MNPQPRASDERLHLRNPVEVAADLRRQLISLGPAVQKRVAAKIAPGLAPARLLPLGMASLLLGVALLAGGRYWALPLVAYGAVALPFNSLARRRYRKTLLAAIDGVIEPDLRLLSSDRTRAEGIASRFGEIGSLDFLEGMEAPSGVPLAQGERVLLSTAGVVRARATKGGLLREAEGRLLLTTARLLFLAPSGLAQIDLTRVVRADVLDGMRLVIVPSKREVPGVYFALGNAHTFAEVIRLTGMSLLH